jgi:tRNA(Ile)-lysidine synthase
MPAASEDAPLSDIEIDALDLGPPAAGMLLAVSGGSDSVALMHLVAARRPDPARIAVATVDHGLRPEARDEAAFVARLAAGYGFAHVTLRWEGEKPASGLQEAARDARYGLLVAEAKRRGIARVLVAHTLDEQAETVLMRLSRGSGVKGLGGMRRVVARDGVEIARPLLEVPKARLRATLVAAGVPWIEDPSNADPRFLRPRLRALMPRLAEEGLDARRLADVAAKMRRADAAIENAVDEVMAAGEARALPVEPYAAAPEEVRLRALERLIRAVVGAEPDIETAQLLALDARLARPPARATLAGALIEVRRGLVRVAPAPPRTKS